MNRGQSYQHIKTEVEQDNQDYDRWNNIVKHLEVKGKPYRVKAGEVHWVGLGKNLGSEIDGKGKRYARPMIVIKTINHNAFIGLPLTTKPHFWPGFLRVQFCDQEEFVILQQIRICSTKRVYNRMGRLDAATFNEIRKSLSEYLELDSELEESDFTAPAGPVKERVSKAKARRVITVAPVEGVTHAMESHHSAKITAVPPAEAAAAERAAKKAGKKTKTVDESQLRPVTTEDEADAEPVATDAIAPEPTPVKHRKPTK